MDLEQAKELLNKTNQYYAEQARSFAGSRRKPWPLLLSLLQYIRKGDRVLDLGCGGGRLYPLIRQQGASYLGLDPSAAMIAEARKMYPEGVFRKADIFDLDLAKWQGKFDVVVILAVLHHFPHAKLREQAVKAIFTVLKNQGYCLVSNWNLFQYRFFKKRLKQDLKKLLGRSDLPWNDLIFKGKRFYHGFSKKEIGRIFQKAGFKIIENYYERDGKKAGRWKGRNIVTVGRKI